MAKNALRSVPKWGKPLPRVNPDSQPYWEGCRQKKLLIQRCGACKTFRFPPGYMCPACGSEKSQWKEVGGRGRVYSYVIVHHPIHPGFVHDVPYAVALVELTGTGKVRIISNIVDCPPGKVKIGMPVELDWLVASEEFALPVFRPRRPAKK